MDPSNNPLAQERQSVDAESAKSPGSWDGRASGLEIVPSGQSQLQLRSKHSFARGAW
jgi:hypothetical protein